MEANIIYVIIFMLSLFSLVVSVIAYRYSRYRKYMILHTYGSLNEKDGDFEKALTYYKEALKIFKTEEIYMSIINIFVKFGENFSALFYADEFLNFNYKEVWKYRINNRVQLICIRLSKQLLLKEFLALAIKYYTTEKLNNTEAETVSAVIKRIETCKNSLTTVDDMESFITGEGDRDRRKYFLKVLNKLRSIKSGKSYISLGYPEI